MTVEALKGIEGITLARGRALEELLRARADELALQPAHRGTLEFVEKKFAKRPEIAQANATAFKAGYAYGETSRTSRSATRSRRRSCARHLPADHRQHGARLRADRRLEALRARPLPRRLPDHAGELDPRGAGAAQELRRPHLPGRGRDRGRRCGARRGLRRLARRHDVRRPGIVLKQETIGLGIMLELPLLDPRHPARRPLDRDADEAGAGRPADGAVRAQLGEPGAGDRGLDAVAVLPRRDRGGRIALKYRTPVYLLSDAYLANGSEPWLIPDVATCRHLDRVRDRRRRASSCPTRAIPRRSHGRGRSRARPGSSTGSAGSRRRTHRQRLLRPREPRPDDAPARAKVAGIADDIPELEVDDPDGAEICSCSAGARRTARSAPR